MSNRTNKHQSRYRNVASKKKENKDEAEVNSPFLDNFKQYAKELDDKHDRYERIVKISRDITIESKRIIFLLHTIDTKKNNSEKVLEEVKTRLHNLFSNQFLLIAQELYKQDAYQFSRAYSAGLQEFIEAFSFLEFLSNKQLSNWGDLQNYLTFTTNMFQNNEEEPKLDVVSCLLQPTEYILGLADVTGELMRRCINSLGAGDIDTCLQCCRVLQNFYTGYVGLDTFRQKDLSRKIFTLRQSVLKSEQVCYNIKVRGSEAALLGATGEASYLSFVGEDNDKVDEGFYD